MVRKNAEETAKKIVVVLGGEKNILSYTNCMTRIRIKVKDSSLVDQEKIRNIPSVIGLVIVDSELQIILGPGFVREVREVIDKKFPDIKEKPIITTNVELSKVAAKNRANQKERNTSSLQVFLTKFATIFTPLIPAFIGAGILAGLAGLLQGIFQEVDPNNSAKTFWKNEVAYSWFKVFNMMLMIWKDAFIIITGWRTAEAFGGEGVYGGIASVMFVGAFAGIYTSPFIDKGLEGFNFLGIKIRDPLTNWLTIGFRPEEVLSNDIVTGYKLTGTAGGVMGALIMAGITVPSVKIIRKFTPGILDLLLTSAFTVVFIIFATYFVVIPASGILFMIISYLFQHLSSNAIGAALLAAMFLVAIVFGVHQGFIPVYVALLTNTGVNSLFAVLAMGGAGLVGASISLYFKAPKDSVLRNQIRGVILPGFFGIGEPLVYGVAVPRPKVFIGAGIGAAMAGFFIGSLSTWGGITIGLNTVFGPAGLSALPLMIAIKGGVVGHNLIAMSIYLTALVIAWVSGFFAMQIIGTKGVDLS